MARQAETSFYWYDYETFGVNSRADRPAQFAGRRTTLDLAPIEEGEAFYAKPAQDCLPSPESCLLTGITPQRCEAEGLPEAEFAGRIWDALNEPGTVSIGYNTLGFDDEVSRFLFWRNFLDPYSHSWAAGCSRWDLFPVVCAVWALRGKGIRWPQWEEIDPAQYPKAKDRKGPCFKLEFLTKANGISHGHAHDALSDVNATIGLAQLIRDAEPKLWAWAFRNRTAEAVLKAAGSGAPVVWVTPKYGIANGCTRIVAALAAKGKELYMWDLMHDPAELLQLSREELAARLFPNREARAAGVKPLPVKRMKANASPFVCGSIRVLDEERAARYGISFETVLENHRRFREIAPQIQPLVLDCVSGEAFPAAEDADLALYGGGFPTPGDKALCRRIRTLSPQVLAAEAAAGRLAFADPRYSELLFRYRARNWPETLSPAEAERWKDLCRRRLIDGEPPFMTVSRYFEEIDRLQALPQYEDEESEAILSSLYDWGERLGEACGG